MTLVCYFYRRKNENLAIKYTILLDKLIMTKILEC